MCVWGGGGANESPQTGVLRLQPFHGVIPDAVKTGEARLFHTVDRLLWSECWDHFPLVCFVFMPEKESKCTKTLQSTR